MRTAAPCCSVLSRVGLWRDARRFARTSFGWPGEGQAEFLAPDGYDVAYRTNAVTRHGEHGNALLSRWPIGDIRHHDVSDHRFEQRAVAFLLALPVLPVGPGAQVVRHVRPRHAHAVARTGHR